MKRIFSSRSGITVLETIIVLIIGSLIISGIWVTYSQLGLNDKIRRTITAVDKTTIATREFLASRNNVPVDLSLQMHNRDLMPAEVSFSNIVGNQANYTSPLGANFVVTSVPGPSQRLFFIRVTFNRNGAECQRLVSSIMGNFRMIKERGLASFSLGLMIRGEAVGGVPLTPDDVPEPSEIVTECSRTNAVGFYFAVRP